MFIVGIDPGLKGGIAYYSPTQLFAYRTPTLEVKYSGKKKKTRTEMDLGECRVILDRSDIDHVFLEKVTARTGQGVTGMFRFGQNLGQWEGLLTGLGIPYTMVTPQVWKRKMDLIGAEKGDSVVMAREIWPDRDEFKYKTADEGRAEAALIAKYGWDNRE